MLKVHKELVPRLPRDEKYDLSDQLKRASKSAPALIAEGFAKRYQKRHWNKYILDTIGECNELIHHITVCIDLYPNHVDANLCQELINTYDICCKQLTKLNQSWQNFHKEK
jgi:four helix bundle protein